MHSCTHTLLLQLVLEKNAFIAYKEEGGGTHLHYLFKTAAARTEGQEDKYDAIRKYALHCKMGH